MKYHKIQTIYKRVQEKGPKKGRLLPGKWTLREFKALAECKWEATEKIDGTNIRAHWDPSSKKLSIHGRTDNAQLPVGLMQHLNTVFDADKLAGMTECWMFGEGFGGKIQAAGPKYRPAGDFDFLLFDVFINGYWLDRDTVEKIAEHRLGVDAVLRYRDMTLYDACELAAAGFQSAHGNIEAEGLILRAPCGIQTRKGDRLICKIKTRDFRNA